MRESTFYILVALLDGPKHGYGIVKEAAALSGGRVRLAAGTLYGALDRLAGDGWVESAGEEIVDGRGRRYYRLTDDGADALREEAARLRAAERLVTARLRHGVRPT